MRQSSGCLWVVVIVIVLILLANHGNGNSTGQSSFSFGNQTSSDTTGQNVDSNSIQNQPVQSAQPVEANPSPTDTTSASYDSLPDIRYYCNRVHYLGGKFPKHFYVGHCIIQSIVQYGWTISYIATIISNTLCTENFACSTVVNTLAKFIKNEINHLNDEDNQCGQDGIYVHWFDVFFRTHPVCS